MIARVDGRCRVREGQEGAVHVLPVRFDLDAIGRIEREIACEVIDVERVVGPVLREAAPHERQRLHLVTCDV
jgi:hypothetical protein